MIILSALRRTVRRAIQPGRELSRAEFLAHRAADGYDDIDVIRFRVERARLHASDAGFLTTGSVGFLALLSAASMAQPARVLDYGGAFGHYGRILQAALPPGAIGKYAVAEHPTFVDSATAAGFAGYVADPRSVDANVVFVSGTLQYLPDPVATLLELMELNARYLVLARNFFSTTVHRYFEQRSTLFEHGAGPIPPGFSNKPVRLFPQAVPIDEIELVLSTRYEIILRTSNTDGVAFDDNGLHGQDLICRRRN